MQFQLTREFLQLLRQAVEENNDQWLREQLHELYPADIAEVINQLDTAYALYLYNLLEDEDVAGVLIELEEEVREKILLTLSSKEIARVFVDNLDSDDAADIIQELPDHLKEEVLAHIEDVEQASDIVDLLHYPEDTAGSIMAKELIKVNLNWTVMRCIKEVRRQAGQIENVYTVYVVDDQEHLQGLLMLKKLLLVPTRTLISELYNPDVISVNAMTPTEEVATIIEKYDLVVIPVVDAHGRLIGRITVDDVMDVIREEADRDYQMLSGISEHIEHTDKLLVISRARLPWLLIALLGGVVASQIIGIYEPQIQIHPEMAFFMPLIAAMGGNVGVQSSSLVVQGLATKALDHFDLFTRLFRELLVGLFNGVACSAILLAYNLIFDHSLALSFTVSLALLSVILFAAIFGTFVPLMLHRYRIDPALATGPFITTSNDIIGLFIYFLIGRMMYSYF